MTDNRHQLANSPAARLAAVERRERLEQRIFFACVFLFIACWCVAAHVTNAQDDRICSAANNPPNCKLALAAGASPTAAVDQGNL